MKRNSFKTAITLIELIISMALVSIVLLGVLSINIVLSNNNQDYGQRFSVRSQTQATLNHILNNASQAIGSASNNQAILIGTSGLGNAYADNANSFCIHQNIPPTPTGTNTIDNQPANPTPGPPYSNTTDRWLCYTWYPSTDPYPYQIWYCAMPYQPSSSPYGASNCNSSENAHISAGPVYLGTAYSIANLPAGSTLPSSPYFNTTQLLFSINIQNCLNDAATGTEACSATGTSGDMTNNPEVQISASAFPEQVSQ